MTTPTDDSDQPIQVHHPVDDGAEPGRGGWLFGGYGREDRPLVSIPPALVGVLLITVLTLALIYLIVRFMHGGRVPADDKVYVPPLISATATPTASPAPSPAASPPASTAPVAPPPVSAAPQAGATSTDPTAALRAWYDTSGLPIIEDLQALVPVVQADADARDYDGLAEDCSNLADMSADARSHRPPGAYPDIASDWDDAADDAAAAASECQTAAAAEDTELLASALAKSRSALVHMQDVIAEVDDII